MARSALLALLLPLGACTYAQGDPHVVVTSTPPGAAILVDGETTGKTTPAKLDLGGFTGGDHEITIRRQGFRTESRRVLHYTTTSSARWIDGATDVSIWTLPLWWTLGDFFLPFGVEWRFVPHELHVRLYRNDEPAPVSESSLGQ